MVLMLSYHARRRHEGNRRKGIVNVSSMITVVVALILFVQVYAAYQPTPIVLPSTFTTSVEIERLVIQRALPTPKAARPVISDDIRRAAVESNDTTSITPSPKYEMRSYQLAIFSVELSDAMSFYATSEGEGDLTTSIASSPVHGWTRLICGSGGLFESYPAPNRHRHSLRVASQSEAHHLKDAARRARQAAGTLTEEDRRKAAGMGGEEGEVEEADKTLALQPGPPIFLVPLHGSEMEYARNQTRSNGQMMSQEEEDSENEEGLHPIYRLLAATRPTKSNRLEFGLVLNYQYGTSNVKRRILSPKELKSCTLKFLKPIQQVHKQRGKVDRRGGNYLVANSGATDTTDTQPWIGDVDFTKKRALSESPVDLYSSESLQESLAILHPFVYSSESMDPWTPSVALLESSVSSEDADGSACQFDPDAPTVFLQSDAGMYGTVASQTRGMMAGLVQPIVSAVTGAFDSIVGGFILNAAQEFVPSGVSDPLAEQVTRQLPPMIARIIIPTIGQTVSASLPPMTTEKITPYASHGISYKTSHDIVEDLSKNLVINIHRLVDIEMPKNLAVHTGNIIPQLLTRSVTHSTVSALTHTLAHSPLHDSFCQMCYQFEKQCEFCHFNQNKIFFGLYYAGYYSTYYGSYYTDYFTGIIAEDRVRALIPGQHQAQDRQRYRRIYSDKGEQVSRSWRRGEPAPNPG